MYHVYIYIHISFYLFISSSKKDSLLWRVVLSEIGVRPQLIADLGVPPQKKTTTDIGASGATHFQTKTCFRNLSGVPPFQSPFGQVQNLRPQKRNQRNQRMKSWRRKWRKRHRPWWKWRRTAGPRPLPTVPLSPDSVTPIIPSIVGAPKNKDTLALYWKLGLHMSWLFADFIKS